MYTDEPFLPVGTQSVILNRIWDEDQDSDLVMGQLPIVQARYRQDARWTLPALAFSGHMCHPEWFSTGEPWPVPSTLPPTVYLAGWIPECCVVCCEFIDCSLDPVNDAPASQWRQYAIPAKDATESTGVVESVIGEAFGGLLPQVRGWVLSYYPTGVVDSPVVTHRILAPATGAGNSDTRQFIADSTHSHTRTVDASGVTEEVVSGGDTTQMTLRVVDGVGKLCGSNLKICLDILPPEVQPRVESSIIAAGSNQSDAEPITFDSGIVGTLGSATGAILPQKGAALIALRVQGALPTLFVKIYPPVGARLGTLAVDAPLTIGHATAYLFTRLSVTNWSYVQLANSPT